jgi:hypothetical protein
VSVLSRPKSKKGISHPVLKTDFAADGMLHGGVFWRDDADVVGRSFPNGLGSEARKTLMKNSWKSF